MQVIVLAAGRSTRIKSDITKMLHEVGKVKILRRVLSNLEKAGLKNIYLVLGHQRDLILKEIPEYRYILQDEQLGTGHAVKCAKGLCSDPNTMVIFGDKPLFSPNTLGEFAKFHLKKKTMVTISTVLHPLPETYAEGYGTVVRFDGKPMALRKIDDNLECDGAIYAFNTEWLWNNIDLLPKHKDEFYLPDIAEVATKQGIHLNEYRIKDYREATGINTPEQLAEAESYLKIL